MWPRNSLQAHPPNERTWLLFGNVAIADAYNRSWTGNAGFVVTNDAVVVIDALGTPKLGKRLIATIKTVTGKPIRYLIVTHNHPDHAYGAVAFKHLGGVTIISHEGAEQYFNSGRWETSVEFRRSTIAPDMQGFEFILPDSAIGGDVFCRYNLVVGGVTFEMYNVGPTTPSVTWWCTRSRIISPGFLTRQKQNLSRRVRLRRHGTG